MTKEPTVTETKLVERIAKEGVNLYAFPNLWNRLNKSEKDNWRNWAEKRILPHVKEALPELAKEAGWNKERVKSLCLL